MFQCHIAIGGVQNVNRIRTTGRCSGNAKPAGRRAGQAGAITSQQVQQAFEEVPRHLFVPRADITTAYSDEPIFIRWEEGIPISSSSQPKMMALMMEQLGLEPGSRVLEIGAGTGYNAAKTM